VIVAVPKVFSIPAGEAFVDRLVEGLVERFGANPLSLADIDVLVPTRRAVRGLREAFLRRSGAGALLLPRIRPIGDIDEDGPIFDGAIEAIDLPPAIDGLRRDLLLARLVMAERERSGAPVDMPRALALAADLSRLLDRMATERVDPARLGDLAPEDLAEHWQTTLDFLKIVTEHWPRILADEGALDPARRRDRVLGVLARRWREHPPAHPVVAAGSTGSIPATADLLAVVARLPQGAVVLPGLDRSMPAIDWDAVDPSHPQAGLKRLLAALGTDRESVEPWTSASGDIAPRFRGLAAALAPAATVDFATSRAAAEAGLAGLVVVDATSEREEADAIALIMRETLETPGRTAALVTPDRALARRVAAALGRWGVAVDDSAGEPLSRSAPGAFLRLVAETATEPDDPVTLLALLKHPLARAGFAVQTHKAEVRALDAALRGPRRKAPLEALADRAASEPWIARIRGALEPFAALLGEREAGLRSLLRAHVAAAEALAADDASSGAARLWAGEAGEALADVVADVDRHADAAGPVAGTGYAALFDGLLAGRSLRARYGLHPRLSIWGLLEARLQRADLTVLGGLNEGVWPAKAEADPWMSRTMAKRLGLEPPERRTGLAAHDFVQAASAPDVVLSRAARIDGAPSVASRWIKRLEAAAPAAMATARRRGELHLARARTLDLPGVARPCAPPQPTPPVALRPKTLSVTEIETWMRDPYAIYAKHVLGLAPLDPLDADPGAADRGIFIHRALAEFLDRSRGAWPADAEARLLEAGRRAFRAVEDRPGLHAFWWPRFERIARWFVAHEASRRENASPVAWEARGTLDLDGFVLRARADRIDRLAGGSLVLIDYKTGRVPRPADVALGYAPQLTLEGAIAQAGGFAGLAPMPVVALDYWRLGGRAGGEVKTLKDGPALIGLALDGLRRLIATFAKPETAYAAVPHPGYAPEFSDYRHLERVDEWSGLAADR
jgi:ATP-dependent helicase/nuclease subunit B